MPDRLCINAAARGWLALAGLAAADWDAHAIPNDRLLLPVDTSPRYLAQAPR